MRLQDESGAHSGATEPSASRAVGLLEGQIRVFERLATGGSLGDVLDLLCRVIEGQGEELLCSVLVLDESGQHLLLGGAPSLPAAYNTAIHGLPIGPVAGSCGTAAYRNEPVIVEDIARDPLWEAFRDLALPLGLRACWSTPIRGHGGAVLGTFAIYYRTTRGPLPFERQLVETATHIASLALQRHHDEQEREDLLLRERRAREDAEAASRAKDALLATVSHELRTPLAPILAWAGVLRTQEVSATLLARAAETIERCARHESQLVGDLLDISRISSGRLNLERRPMDILEAVTKALEVVRPAAEAKDVALTLEAIGVDGRLQGDPDRLQQVFWNLLANAVKFTPGGGRVIARVLRAPHALTVTVIDTGEGIDPAFLPLVFEPFRQADTADTRRHSGLGLGLAIVRHLVELHGGTVHATSEGHDHGATFAVRLPVGSSAGDERVPDESEATIEVASLCRARPD